MTRNSNPDNPGTRKLDSSQEINTAGRPGSPEIRPASHGAACNEWVILGERRSEMRGLGVGGTEGLSRQIHVISIAYQVRPARHYSQSFAKPRKPAPGLRR